MSELCANKESERLSRLQKKRLNIQLVHIFIKTLVQDTKNQRFGDAIIVEFEFDLVESSIKRSSSDL